MPKVRHLLSICDMSADQMAVLLSASSRYWQSLERDNSLTNLLEEYAVAMICWPLPRDSEPGNLVSAYDQYMTESFVTAAERLGATTVSPNPHLEKALEDIILDVKLITEEMPGKTLAAVVARHNNAGIPNKVSTLNSVGQFGISVINGGDGDNENPTEALVYLHVISRHFERIAALSILMVADVNHDPLAKSLLCGLSLLGADTHVVAPPQLVSASLSRAIGVTVHNDFASVMMTPDVILSIPVEPYVFEQGILPSREEYLNHYSLASFLNKPTDRTMMVIPCRSRVPDESADHIAGFDADRLGARIEQPSEHDELAVRMAAFDYCLHPTADEK